MFWNSRRVTGFGILEKIEWDWDKIIATIHIPNKQVIVRCEIPKILHQTIIFNFFNSVKKGEKVYIRFIATYKEIELPSSLFSKDPNDFTFVECKLSKISDCKIGDLTDRADFCFIKMI